MSVELLIANNLRIAAQDLKDARLLAGANSRNAVYLCEQAAEKIITAVLTSENKHGGIKHRLNEMVDLVPDDNRIKKLLRDIEDLAAYATAYRYPTAEGRIKPSPDPRDLEKFIKMVDDALSAAAKGFAVDLNLPNSPAGNKAPLR